MANRTVRVTLEAVTQNYIAGMRAAQQATQATGTAAEQLQQQRQGLETLGKVLLAIGGVAATGVAAAVKAFADFDAQMSQVKTLSHATASEMDSLRNAALTMGQGIGFSATEVADAETELVKAGVSVQDILGGGLKGALDLAAAGQIDVADATQIATVAMTQFGLSGKDVPHVADLLAAGADKALGSVSELGQALNQSGLVAAQFGLSVDQTVGTLAEFAQNGLIGSDAGTSLKQMFLQLANPSKQAAEAMKDYNIQAYDAQGNFVGITGLAGQLAKGFKNAEDAQRDSALATIFGSDAIRAANILFKDGAEGNQKWVDAVNDSGFAAAQAAGKMDNLKGDISKLQSAMEAGLINTGSAANDSLRTITQTLTGLIGAFNSAPKPVQDAVLALGILTGAVGLAGGAFLTLGPKIAEARAQINALRLSGRSLAGTLGKGAGLAIALGAITEGLSAIGQKSELSADQLSSLNAAAKLDSVKDLNKLFEGGGTSGDILSKRSTGLKDALDELSGGANGARNAFAKFLTGLPGGFIPAANSINKFEAQFSQLSALLAETAKTDLPTATAEFNKLVKTAGGGSDAVKKLLDRSPEYKAALIDLAAQQGKSVSDQELLNLAQGKGALAAEIGAAAAGKQQQALSELAGSASAADEKVSDLAKAIKDFGSTQLDANEAERAFQAAIDDAQKSLKDNGRSLDINTEKGRNNSEALDAIASSAIASTAAIVNNGGSQEQATAKMTDGRKAYIDFAESLGKTADEANDMADQIKLIPGNVSTAFGVTGVSEAQEAVQALGAHIDAITGKRVIPIAVVLTGTSIPSQIAAQVHGKIAFADGGEINGPGPKGKDSVVALLAPGEHVLTDSDVDKMGGQGGVYRFRKALQGGRIPAFRKGGAVSISDAEAALNDAVRDRHQVKDDIATARATRDKRVRELRAAKKAEDKAEAIQGRDRANQVLTQLGKDLAAAQKRQSDAEAQLAKSKKEAVDKAAAEHAADVAKAKKEAADAANEKAESRYSAAVDFRSSVRSAAFTADSGVSQLYRLAVDNDYSKKARTIFASVADRTEAALTKLGKQSDAAADKVDKATTKLDDLKSAAASMAQSISSKLSDSGLGDATTAKGFEKNLGTKRTRLLQLQKALAALRKRGLAPALLAEIAELGVDHGLAMAQSFMGMSTKDLRQVNSDYTAVQGISGKIGASVSDANYGKLIDAAEKQLEGAQANAKAITDQIAASTDRLEKLIGNALGLPGYSVGGYTGPGSKTDIRGFVHADEFVSTKETLAYPGNRAALAFMHAGGVFGPGSYVRPTYAQPTTAAIDYGRLAAAVGSGRPREVVAPQVVMHPIRDNDPHTTAVIAARELERQMRG